MTYSLNTKDTLETLVENEKNTSPTNIVQQNCQYYDLAKNIQIEQREHSFGKSRCHFYESDWTTTTLIRQMQGSNVQVTN